MIEIFCRSLGMLYARVKDKCLFIFCLMMLEEERITNLLYLIGQIKTLTINDSTAVEKRRAVFQMAKLGLLKYLGHNTYGLDTLGQEIVDSKKSYTQYLAHQKTLNNATTKNLLKSVQVKKWMVPFNNNLNLLYKSVVLILSVLTIGFLIYWLGIHQVD